MMCSSWFSSKWSGLFYQIMNNGFVCQCHLINNGRKVNVNKIVTPLLFWYKKAFTKNSIMWSLCRQRSILTYPLHHFCWHRSILCLWCLFQSLCWWRSILFFDAALEVSGGRELFFTFDPAWLFPFTISAVRYLFFAFVAVLCFSLSCRNDCVFGISITATIIISRNANRFRFRFRHLSTVKNNWFTVLRSPIKTTINSFPLSCD